MPPLIRHLQAACFVVIAYLTATRPQEARTLPIDALDTIPSDDPAGPVRYLIEGSKRKAVRSRGERVIEGEGRAWVTIGPGADAFHTAQAIARIFTTDPDYLFPSARHTAVANATMAKRVADMIRWANSLIDDLALPDVYRIQTDGDEDTDGGGSWALSAFRRTISWHIYDQPGGELALGLQLGHAAKTLGRDGYASVSNVGVRNMMDRAAREAHEATLMQVGDALIRGTHVSGPAAERLVAAAQLAHPVLASFASEREAKQVLSSPGAAVFDNPDQYSLCVYVPHLAQ